MGGTSGGIPTVVELVVARWEMPAVGGWEILGLRKIWGGGNELFARGKGF